jgi:hypothetical protein
MSKLIKKITLTVVLIIAAGFYFGTTAQAHWPASMWNI